MGRLRRLRATWLADTSLTNECLTATCLTSCQRRVLVTACQRGLLFLIRLTQDGFSPDGLPETAAVSDVFLPDRVPETATFLDVCLPEVGLSDGYLSNDYLPGGLLPVDTGMMACMTACLTGRCGSGGRIGSGRVSDRQGMWAWWVWA